MYTTIAMDLDGTLTQHKCPLEADCKAALDILKAQYKLVVVGAGSCERIWKQMCQYSIDIIGNYGMQASTVIDGNFKVIKNDCVTVNKEMVDEKVMALRRQFGLYEYVGDSVEFHDSGMITFPLLGTKAALPAKLQYDPLRQRRRKMLQAVRGTFLDYTVFIGGSSSFDIVPLPYNKLFALNFYTRQHNTLVNQVIYIGDDYGPGGNDEQVYLSDYTFIKTDTYLQFPEIAKKLVKH